MSRFDRFADWVADRWSSAPWFALCALFVLGWVGAGFVRGLWTNDLFHLALNSPTTGLTFLGVFLLHNSQHRFETAVNARIQAIMEAFDIEDPVEDDGQKELDG